MQYIRLKDKLEGIKRSGGTPNYLPPKNLDGLIKVRDNLFDINLTNSKDFFYLTHNKKTKYDVIPPISRRFIKAMNFLFSNNKLTYELTRFDEDKEELKFLYELGRAQIEDAKIKIERTIEFFYIMQQKMKITEEAVIKSLFNEKYKAFWSDNIKEFKSLNFLNIFSLSSLREVVYSSSQNFGSLKIVPKASASNEGNHYIRFASVKYKDEARRKLKSLGIKIEEETNTSIICKVGNIDDIEGIWSIEPVIETHITKDERILDPTQKLIKGLKSSFEDSNTNSIDVGVIDGGIPEDSFIMELLSSYKNNVSLFGEDKPKGNHAEKVCSVLLCANKLKGIEDELTTPRVHLFDVMGDDEDTISYQNKIRKVVSENTHIKLWNLSIVIPYEKDSMSITPVGVFLDQLQEEFDVQFIIASGNWTDDDNTENISAPSGSFIGFSVGAVNIENEPTSYSKIGYRKYVTAKPDIAIFGGDGNWKINAISNNCITKVQGTSFATPLVVRKLAYLMSQNMSTSEAISTLIAYANYYSTKNSIEITNYNGHGVIPVDSKELINLVNNKAVVIMTLDLLKNYTSGYFGIKLPKNPKNKYDFSYYLGQNVRARFEQNETFEYVLDSVRTSFGKVYGAQQNRIQTWTNSNSNAEDKDEGNIESFLRSYEGKYKSRDSFNKITRQDINDFFTVSGEKWKLEQWGLRLTRNAVLSSYRKNKMSMSISIIFESKNINNLFDQIKVINESIIESIHENVVENYIELE